MRIGIGLHRTDGGNNYGLQVRSGTEAQDSPRESYDDASNDFHFEGRFIHDRPTPTVGDTVGGTQAANQILGNPEIFYQIIHTHASLVGDGTVSASHISSGSSADGEVLTADGSGGAAFEASQAGLSGSDVEDFAKTASTTKVSAAENTRKSDAPAGGRRYRFWQHAYHSHGGLRSSRGYGSVRRADALERHGQSDGQGYTERQRSGGHDIRIERPCGHSLDRKRRRC